MATLVYVTLLVLTCGCMAVQTACPAVCECTEGGLHVDCSHRALTALPNDLHTNITTLNFSANNLLNLGQFLFILN